MLCVFLCVCVCVWNMVKHWSPVVAQLVILMIEWFRNRQIGRLKKWWMRCRLSHWRKFFFSLITSVFILIASKLSFFVTAIILEYSYFCTKKELCNQKNCVKKIAPTLKVIVSCVWPTAWYHLRSGARFFCYFDAKKTELKHNHTDRNATRLTDTINSELGSKMHDYSTIF